MEKEKRFEIILEENHSIGVDGIKIIRDKETGIQYLFNRNGNAGGMTVLLDKDGKPIVSK